jgi:hypothetical protein
MSKAADYNTNEENQAKQKAPLENLLGVNFMKNGQNNNSKSRDNASNTHTIIAYKYSNNKRETLHESVILAGHPMFIRYKNGQVEAVEQIDEE